MVVERRVYEIFENIQWLYQVWTRYLRGKVMG